MSFNLLHEKLQKAIADLGHTQATPIQEKAIPEILARRDIQGSAQTGTGKTAAFVLPMIHRLLEGGMGPAKGPRALILAPTRELAMQITTEINKYTKHLPHIKTVCIFGGTPYPIQNKQLSRPYDILVATPGRLIDHLERNRIHLDRIQMLVLDEADRMLDMGFIEPVEHIASQTPEGRQTLLFSATMKRNVLQLSQRLLKNPLEIRIEADNSQVERIEQQVHTVDNIDHKYRLLTHILEAEATEQVIVFTATKRQADELSDRLCEAGHEASPLHGDLNQRQRTRTIARLRRGDFRVLVATDVAARGIDIPSIRHVINFDLPNNGEEYVHRIGRTGRAGATGVALSFAAYRDYSLLREIENYIGKDIPKKALAGFEATPRASGPRKFGDKKFGNNNFGNKRFGRPFNKGPGRFQKGPRF